MDTLIITGRGKERNGQLPKTVLDWYDNRYFRAFRYLYYQRLVRPDPKQLQVYVYEPRGIFTSRGKPLHSIYANLHTDPREQQAMTHEAWVREWERVFEQSRKTWIVAGEEDWEQGIAALSRLPMLVSNTVAYTRFRGTVTDKVKGMLEVIREKSLPVPVEDHSQLAV